MCVILGITSLFYLDVNQVVGARTTWVVTVILRASVRGWSRRDGMTCRGLRGLSGSLELEPRSPVMPWSPHPHPQDVLYPLQLSCHQG